MKEDWKIPGSGNHVLDKALCDKLVQAASLTIGCNVLITNEKGWIVSSNDPRREGELHEASIQAIQTKQTLYHNRDAAKELVGTLPGFTTPLFMEDRVIGTIGVTGRPQEISRYVELMKQMAQAFLGFYSQQQTSVQQDYRKQNLLREIVTFDPRIRDPQEIHTLAYEVGVDMSIPRVAILVKNCQEEDQGPSQEELLEVITRFFQEPHDFLCHQNDSEHVILATLPDGMKDSSMTKIVHTCQEMYAAFRAVGATVLIGVGSLAKNLAGLRLSYENACFVVRIQQSGLRKDTVLSIDDLMLEKLAASLPEAVCEEAETGVFAPVLHAPNREEIMQIIECWCRLRFQFTKTAEALHIHKSTLVYRFRRIQEMYGLDLYDFDRVMALYLLHIRRKLK